MNNIVMKIVQIHFLDKNISNCITMPIASRKYENIPTPNNPFSVHNIKKKEKNASFNVPTPEPDEFNSMNSKIMCIVGIIIFLLLYTN